MNNININISYHKKQIEFFENIARFKVQVCGRRFGKTRGNCNDKTEMLVNSLLINKSIYIGHVAPVYSQSEIAYNEFLENYYHPLKEKGLVRENKTKRTFFFSNGSKYIFLSADRPDRLVGFKFHHLDFDEAGIMDLKTVWELMRPSLMDYNGTANFFGTPRGKNAFYDLFMKGQDPNNKDWHSISHSSFENPLIDDKEIQELIDDLPESIVQQEIFAKFLDNGTGVFKDVDNCIKDLIKCDKDDKEKWFFGLDLAKYQDFTVLYGINESKTKYVFERFNKIDWKFQIKKIIEIVSKFKKHDVLMDSTGVGDPIYEALKDEITVTGFNFTNESKYNLINALAVDIQEQKIFYPNIALLLLELKNYEMEFTKSGKIRYNAPVGKHDDIVIAIALCNKILNRKIKAIKRTYSTGMFNKR